MRFLVVSDHGLGGKMGDPASVLVEAGSPQEAAQKATGCPQPMEISERTDHVVWCTDAKSTVWVSVVQQF